MLRVRLWKSGSENCEYSINQAFNIRLFDGMISQLTQTQWHNLDLHCRRGTF